MNNGYVGGHRTRRPGAQEAEGEAVFGATIEKLLRKKSKTNFFMNKFRKLGFIQYKGSIHVNNSLLSVVLHD
jgi:CRP/FNR family transcriptional regulator, cyclic AMP receptor protein